MHNGIKHSLHMRMGPCGLFSVGDLTFVYSILCIHQVYIYIALFIVCTSLAYSLHTIRE